MKVYRVSAVERFRQFEQDDEAEVSALIADITGQSEPSAAMVAGTAFHKALELASTGALLESIEQDGHRFDFPADLTVELPPIRELRASKVYTVDGEPICISGQVDAIDGLRVIDHKTTGQFSPDRYIEGYQWRLYLDIFGADAFRWNVFEISERTGPNDECNVYEVRAAHVLEQHRYPRLGADCQALVERFARFVREFVEGVAAC